MTHRWTENARDHARTVRICARCGLIKLSRHEMQGGRMMHWTEFYRGSDRIRTPDERTPACDVVEVEA